MSGTPIRAVLGQLGLTQVRYVSPVRRGAARGLVGRVYNQIEQEFGVLAPSVALHSPAPEVLAATWLMLREVLVVTGTVDRTAKEAVSAAVSIGNTCPWCTAVHSATFSGLSGSAAAVGPGQSNAAAVGPGQSNAVRSITDPRLRAIATWATDSGTAGGVLVHDAAWLADYAPDLVGSGVLVF